MVVSSPAPPLVPHKVSLIKLRQATSVIIIPLRVRVQHAECFEANEQAGSTHVAYLEKLKMGVHLRRQLSLLDRDATCQREVRRVASVVASGAVTTEVEDASQLGGIAFHRQGDAQLSTEERMRERILLRDHPSVKEVIAAFFTTMQRTPGCTQMLDSRNPNGRVGDAGVDEIAVSEQGYKALFSRAYKLLIEEWDATDAEATIRDDWEHDSGGLGHLLYRAFFAGLFELVDVWCRSIGGVAYARYLWQLYESVVDETGGWRDMDTIAFSASLSSDELNPDVDPSGRQRQRAGKSRRRRQGAVTIQAQQRRRKGQQTAGDRREATLVLQAQRRGLLARRESQVMREGVLASQQAAECELAAAQEARRALEERLGMTDEEWKEHVSRMAALGRGFFLKPPSAVVSAWSLKAVKPAREHFFSPRSPPISPSPSSARGAQRGPREWARALGGGRSNAPGHGSTPTGALSAAPAGRLTSASRPQPMTARDELRSSAYWREQIQLQMSLRPPIVHTSRALLDGDGAPLSRGGPPPYRPITQGRKLPPSAIAMQASRLRDQLPAMQRFYAACKSPNDAPRPRSPPQGPWQLQSKPSPASWRPHSKQAYTGQGLAALELLPELKLASR